MADTKTLKVSGKKPFLHTGQNIESRTLLYLNEENSLTGLEMTLACMVETIHLYKLVKLQEQKSTLLIFGKHLVMKV